MVQTNSYIAHNHEVNANEFFDFCVNSAQEKNDVLPISSIFIFRSGRSIRKINPYNHTIPRKIYSPLHPRTSLCESSQTKLAKIRFARPASNGLTRARTCTYILHGFL